MPDTEHRQQLFIVRFWHEDSRGEPAAQWRGSVEHVQSGQRLYFVSLNDLTDFMTLRLGSIRGANTSHKPPDER